MKGAPYQRKERSLPPHATRDEILGVELLDLVHAVRIDWNRRLVRPQDRIAHRFADTTASRPPIWKDAMSDSSIQGPGPGLDGASVECCVAIGSLAEVGSNESIIQP